MTNWQLGRCVRSLATLFLASLLPSVATLADPFYPGAPPNYLSPRAALVVGIGNYNSMRPLGNNPINDAQKVTALLKGMGFDPVITSIDDGRTALLNKLDELETKIARDSGVMLIYYSGHGLSSGGNSYIVPADAKLRRTQDLDDYMISLDRIYQAIDRAQPRQAILVFDACRNDPFNGAVSAVNSEAGLKSTKFPSSGTYVAYSTVEGKTASNGVSDDSPFTKAFLLYAPSQPTLSDVFTRIREHLVSPLIHQPSNSLDGFVGHFKFLMTQDDFISEQQDFKRVQQNDISSLYDNFMNTYRSGYFYVTAADLSSKAKEREALAVPTSPAGPQPPSVVPTPAIPGLTNTDVQLQPVPNPESDAKTVIVSKGTPVVVLGRTDDAYKVAVAGGGEGYVPQTTVQLNSIPGQTKTIALSDNGKLRDKGKVTEAGAQAVQQSQTVVVQTTLPSGAASDKATAGLKATLDTVDTLVLSGVRRDKVVVSATLHQGPEFKLKLLNLQN
jgi:hypothetical protein